MFFVQCYSFYTQKTKTISFPFLYFVIAKTLSKKARAKVDIQKTHIVVFSIQSCVVRVPFFISLRSRLRPHCQFHTMENMVNVQFSYWTSHHAVREVKTEYVTERTVDETCLIPFASGRRGLDVRVVTCHDMEKRTETQTLTQVPLFCFLPWEITYSLGQRPLSSQTIVHSYHFGNTQIFSRIGTLTNSWSLRKWGVPVYKRENYQT